MEVVFVRRWGGVGGEVLTSCYVPPLNGAPF